MNVLGSVIDDRNCVKYVGMGIGIVVIGRAVIV